ncbi:hypothetical protein DL771_009630 [Monosporascus sp. 5C6A]|nr:hypothetical protein DL771_009630 [Monosporascus sp. 5C6A]
MLAGACAPDTFTTPPYVFGAEVLSIVTSLVTNYTMESDAALRFVHPSTTAENLTFCNVTVTYTHTGTNDRVNVETWLPVSDWNERLYAAGGGGFAAGRFFIPYTTMAGALTEGYATVTTDAGLGVDAHTLDASSWALLSPGNIDLNLAYTFGSASLNEEVRGKTSMQIRSELFVDMKQAIIAKHLLKSFYGKGPVYSYWNGCSQGGRQGLMLAQRYPHAFDGIAAGAPALNLPQADDIIPPKGTEAYYQDVSNLLPDVHDFYRHFEIPGLAHCSGGLGGQPTAMFEQLRAWVENGTAPKSSPVTFVNTIGEEWNRILTSTFKYYELIQFIFYTISSNYLKAASFRKHSLAGNAALFSFRSDHHNCILYDFKSVVVRPLVTLLGRAPWMKLKKHRVP